MADYTPEAQGDLRAAIDWYEDRRPGLGWELLAEVMATDELITENPGIGRPLSGGVRRHPVGRFPYHLIYLAEQPPLVLAVAHHRRHPQTWQKRLPKA